MQTVALAAGAEQEGADVAGADCCRYLCEKFVVVDVITDTGERC